MAPVLQLENVGIRISAAREILSDLHLALDAGDLAVVAGRRGSGKSLLAALAAGDRPADRGRVRLFGQDAWALGRGERTRLRRRIGWCADRTTLLPELSAANNVALPLLIAGGPAAEARADATELLSWLGEDDPSRPARHATPEGVMRIAVARAFVARPALAILDEPLRDGAAVPFERLAALIGDMRRAGGAFLITTDDPTLAGRLGATWRFALEGGRLQRT